MSFTRTYPSQGSTVGTFHGDTRSSFSRQYSSSANTATTNINNHYGNSHMRNFANSHDFSSNFGEHNCNVNYANLDVAPSLKRRKLAASSWEGSRRNYQQPLSYDNDPSTCDYNFVLPDPARPEANAYTSTNSKRDRSKFEDDLVFMSRDEIERCSPSRKDGIDALRETHLRYSYCAFLQNLGLRLELPQTTTGTAMVLCHRFFVRRSHAYHDRFLIATAALFLAAKSEETPRPLNDVVRVSCEVFHKQDLTFLSYLLPVDWFEQYRERVIEAEQMILTTLDFELNVRHPYVPLTSVLNKLGFSQSFLVTLALNLVSEGLRSSLWLQFKPHQIAAGATYLAAKILNMDLASDQSISMEFQTPPSILKDIAQQFMELF